MSRTPFVSHKFCINIGIAAEINLYYKHVSIRLQNRRLLSNCPFGHFSFFLLRPNIQQQKLCHTLEIFFSWDFNSNECWIQLQNEADTRATDAVSRSSGYLVHRRVVSLNCPSLDELQKAMDQLLPSMYLRVLHVSCHTTSFFHVVLTIVGKTTYISWKMEMAPDDGCFM